MDILRAIGGIGITCGALVAVVAVTVAVETYLNIRKRKSDKGAHE